MASKDKKYWQQVLEEAEEQGLLVERPGERRNKDGSRKKSRHTRITHRVTGDFVTVANTPSDRRSSLNAIAEMRRRLGFVWNGRGGPASVAEAEEAA